MLEVLILAVLLQIPCEPGHVLEVSRGRDYTLNICGVGMVALRGVEPPLAVAEGYPPLGRMPPGADPNLPISGDVLGDKDIGPQALQFLRELFVGKRVTIAEAAGESAIREGADTFMRSSRIRLLSIRS